MKCVDTAYQGLVSRGPTMSLIHASFGSTLKHRHYSQFCSLRLAYHAEN